MKLTSLLCLTALSAAAKQDDGSAAQAQAQAPAAQDDGSSTQGGAQDTQAGYSQAQDTQDYGNSQAQDTQDYGNAPAESYAAPVESYAAPAVTMSAPSLCLAPCPSHAPCLNKKTGACTAKMMFANYEPQYAQADYSQSGGYAQQGGYAQGGAQDDGADTGYGRHLSSSGGCPRGTEDSNNLHVTHRWPLWTGFALLLIPSLVFLWNASDELQKAVADKDKPRGLKLTIAGFICMVASLAYLTMATGNGFITRCCDGRSFYYARYIDWTITTPLMLWELSRLAQDFNVTVTDDTEFYYLVFLDILMVISGLIGGLMCNSDKWALFGFSMLCFIPIMKQLCDWDTDNVGNDADIQKKYRSARNITIGAWSVYPLIWILSEGTGVLSANGEAIAYTVLDVIAKSFFGWIVVSKIA